MDRKKPVPSKILEQKRQEYARKVHLDHLKASRSFIDCHNLANWTHLTTKAKRMQTEEEKYCDIERDNAILLAKMSVIARGKGEVDCGMPNKYGKTSMNIYVRTQEQIKVQEENKAIVSRIRARKANMSAAKFEEEYQQNERMMKSICEFPYQRPDKPRNQSFEEFKMNETRQTMKRPAAMRSMTAAQKVAQNEQNQQMTRSRSAPTEQRRDIPNKQDSNTKDKGDVSKLAIQEDVQEDEEGDDEEEEEVPWGKGIVVVKIIGVKDVAAVDSNGKSDPYIKIRIGDDQEGRKNEKRTKRAKDTLNAEYNENFEFDFDPEATQARELTLELWDHDTLSDDDQIGRLLIPLSPLKNCLVALTCQFEGVNKQFGKDVGQIDLEVGYKISSNEEEDQVDNKVDKEQQPQSEQKDNVEEKEIKRDIQVEQEQEEYEQGQIIITIIGVKNVAAMDSNGKSDPYVKIILADKTERTKKVADTLNAEYNQTFNFAFDPSSTQERDLKLELWDHDTMSDDDQIGKVSLPFLPYKNNKQKASFTFTGVNKLYGKDVGVVDIDIIYDTSTQTKNNELSTEGQQGTGGEGGA